MFAEKQAVIFSWQQTIDLRQHSCCYILINTKPNLNFNSDRIEQAETKGI